MKKLKMRGENGEIKTTKAREYSEVQKKKGRAVILR
jgi:hypothetical protein